MWENLLRFISNVFKDDINEELRWCLSRYTILHSLTYVNNLYKKKKTYVNNKGIKY
jgi:hypothetical protein